MKIVLESDESILVEPVPGPMTIEADSAERSYSPFHMLASALATCTLSVLDSWATNAKISTDGMSLRVHWSFVDDPHRVGSFQVIMQWPGLPAERIAAAQRVAALCGVHNTLTHPPTIALEVG